METMLIEKSNENTKCMDSGVFSEPINQYPSV